MKLRFLVGWLGLSASACALSQQDWGKLVESSRTCAAGDTCVLFSDPCLCATPVNQSQVATLDANQSKVVCQSMADCALPPVNGRCLGDRPDGG